MIAAILASLAAWVWFWSPRQLGRVGVSSVVGSSDPAGLSARIERRTPRLRWIGIVLCGLAGWTLAPAGLAVVAAPVAAGCAWWALSRLESSAQVKLRLAAGQQLPMLVLLFAISLRAGLATQTAIARACAALPGPAADLMTPTRHLLELGADPVQAWGRLKSDPVLAPLARVMSRAEQSGAPVAEAVTRLADELGAARRHAVELRARTVGVKAAVPLGLCFLPGFIALGIVPLAAGLLSQLLN